MAIETEFSTIDIDVPLEEDNAVTERGEKSIAVILPQGNGDKISPNEPRTEDVMVSKKNASLAQKEKDQEREKLLTFSRIGDILKAKKLLHSIVDKTAQKDIVDSNGGSGSGQPLVEDNAVTEGGDKNSTTAVLPQGNGDQISRNKSRTEDVMVSKTNAYLAQKEKDQERDKFLTFCRIGDLQKVKKLLDSISDETAQKDLVDSNGGSGSGQALRLAAKDDRPELCEILLQHGADVNLQSSQDGRTALIMAATYGRFGVCEILLKYKPDLEICDKKNHTALIEAIEERDGGIIEILINAGADLTKLQEHEKSIVIQLGESQGLKFSNDHEHQLGKQTISLPQQKLGSALSKVLVVYGCCSGYFDTISDLYSASRLQQSHNPDWAGLCFAFTVLPVLMAAILIREKDGSFSSKVFIKVLTVLHLRLLYETYQCLLDGITEETKGLVCVKYTEAIYEAIPQLIVQTYALLYLWNEGASAETYLVVSIIASIASASWVITCLLDRENIEKRSKSKLQAAKPSERSLCPKMVTDIRLRWCILCTILHVGETFTAFTNIVLLVNIFRKDSFFTVVPYFFISRMAMFLFVAYYFEKSRSLYDAISKCGTPFKSVSQLIGSIFYNTMWNDKNRFVCGLVWSVIECIWVTAYVGSGKGKAMYGTDYAPKTPFIAITWVGAAIQVLLSFWYIQLRFLPTNSSRMQGTIVSQA